MKKNPEWTGVLCGRWGWGDVDTSRTHRGLPSDSLPLSWVHHAPLKKKMRTTDSSPWHAVSSVTFHFTDYLRRQHPRCAPWVHSPRAQEQRRLLGPSPDPLNEKCNPSHGTLTPIAAGVYKLLVFSHLHISHCGACVWQGHVITCLTKEAEASSKKPNLLLL